MLEKEKIIDYTQLPYGPWAQVYKDYKDVRSVISKDSIKQYIRKDEAQRELVEFINNGVTNKESALVKTLTPQKDNNK